MFGVDVKPRKLTTYGKPAKQQGLGFKSFLDNSPEKQRTKKAVQASPTKAVFGRPRDGSKVADTWDVPSDDDQVVRDEKHCKSKEKGPVSQKRMSDIRPGEMRLKPSTPIKETLHSTAEAADRTSQRKRKRGETGQTVVQRDIFDVPDDNEDGECGDPMHAAPSAVLKLPARGRAKTPAASSNSSATTTRIRSARDTPEPYHERQMPLTSRKTTFSDDIYNIPDDDDPTDANVKPRPVGQIPHGAAHKRRKTPSRDMRTVGKGVETVQSRSMALNRPRTIVTTPSGNPSRKAIVSPMPRSSNGVIKRTFGKNTSTTMSLSKIRDPPSTPAEYSDNAATPGTPDIGSEMEIEPLMSPHSSGSVSASPAVTSAISTPRNKLWSQLLGANLADSANEMSMSELQLSSGVKASSRNDACITESGSDTPQRSTGRRSRLIDSLKATAPISAVEEMDVNEPTEIDSNTSVKTASSDLSKAYQPNLHSEGSFKQTSAKITYGQGRTYLEERNEEKMWDMLAAEETRHGYTLGGSYSQEAMDDDDEMEGTTQPRAAHDLRAAGTRRRLHDEMSMMLMDVEQSSNSMSIRRSALRDLAEKLIDKEAAVCFLESGLDSSFLKAVERDTDNVFLFLEAAVIALLVSADPTSTVLDHIFHSPVFSNIFKLLELSVSLEQIVGDRKSNMAKISQSMVLELRDQLFATDVWGQNKPRDLTPRALGLHSIEMVIRKLREHGSSYTLLDEPAIRKILDIVRAEMAVNDPDVAVVELALSALQVNTVSTPILRHEIWPTTLVQAFSGLLPSLLILHDGSASMSVQLALKLAVELTNYNAAACDMIGVPAVIDPLLSNANKRYAQLLDHKAGDAYSITFDLTVLSFGLTINLTEASDDARLAMLQNEGVALDEAIDLFVRGKKRAEDAVSIQDTQMNIIYGCVAFTLGNLSRNAVLRKIIAGRLGGNLNIVLDAMQEFAAINRLTDKKEFEGEEGHEVSKSFTERLQAVFDEVKALNA
ncbi:uncharacterized protein PV09_00291 [Verruconis gallopava]|uniref:Wings apart-like protein C-terminal domain-containing protein n=1 Tax=Verruconis gallopava TaxID=253628 RepID=A0A0D1Z8R3_9PEZI|nr:uncharacterized protein PV09_00291 [Verruconis gallopava]KIW09397.1 hypothetical protein PV09_00291 [Verruconis gallopava]